jgi:hypothetical protein
MKRNTHQFVHSMQFQKREPHQSTSEYMVVISAPCQSLHSKQWHSFSIVSSVVSDHCMLSNEFFVTAMLMPFLYDLSASSDVLYHSPSGHTCSIAVLQHRIRVYTIVSFYT